MASALNRHRFATLLFDLLTPAKEDNRANVFDIALLADRLVDAVRWLEGEEPVAKRAQPMNARRTHAPPYAGRSEMEKGSKAEPFGVFVWVDRLHGFAK